MAKNDEKRDNHGMEINLQEIRRKEENKKTVIYETPIGALPRKKHRALVGWMDGEGLVFTIMNRKRERERKIRIHIHTYKEKGTQKKNLKKKRKGGKRAKKKKKKIKMKNWTGISLRYGAL